MSEHHDASAPPMKRQRQASSRAINWYLYPASRTFPVGSRVFVKPKSAKELGRRGTVMVDDDATVSTNGKVNVQFDDRNNEEKRVIGKRIFPIFSTAATTTCLVTADTASYRNLASSQLTKSKSVVLEIGCSTGEASVILTKYSEKWMGLDTSDSMVAQCKVSLCDDKAKAFKVDALADPCRATKLVLEEVGSPNVVFLDIGGNRECEGVLRMIDWVLDTFVTKTAQGLLVVIKSRELHAKFKEECTTAPDSDGLITNGSIWIQQQLQRLNRKIPSHPLQAPLRRRYEGYPQPICRYHNYHKNGGCKKHEDGGQCELDHNRCHMCLSKGHIALACPMVAQDKKIDTRQVS